MSAVLLAAGWTKDAQWKRFQWRDPVSGCWFDEGEALKEVARRAEGRGEFDAGGSVMARTQRAAEAAGEELFDGEVDD